MVGPKVGKAVVGDAVVVRSLDSELEPKWLALEVPE